MLKCALSVMAIALLALSSLAAAEPPLIELEHVATVDIPGEIYGIDTANDYVYAVTGEPGAFYIIDASEPRNASIVGNFTEIADSEHVFISDERAYVQAGLSILVFDIASPAEIELLGYYMPPGGFGRLQAASGPYAYYTSHEPDGFGVIDASDPTNITKAGYYAFPNAQHHTHHPRSVVLRNEIAFVIDQSWLDDNFLWIIDISNPYHLRKEGNYPIPVEYNNVGALSCDCLIIGSDILRAIDMSDPRNPNELGNYDDSTASRMVIDDYYAFITPDKSRVDVIDVIDPTDMALTFSINSSFQYITGMEVDNGYLFVSQRDNYNDSSYLHIYRIDDRRLLPDLAFVDDALQFDRTAIMRREIVRMNATVINNGPGPTAFALATLTVDGHATIASFKVPPLKANETWEIVYEIANLTKGKHTFNLTITQECDRAELRTDNNRVTASVRVVDFTQSTPSFVLTWGQLVLASVLFAFLGGRRRIF